MTSIFSYVVAYDSGFAPNPFFGYCTLATCKPKIRKLASVGDWLLGTASNRQGVCRGGHLVYAMRVDEALTLDEYWSDDRFRRKRPSMHGSYRMACGDNIYHRASDDEDWTQSESFHSKQDGSRNQEHVDRDTKVNRVLVSEQFIYFGGEGPSIPDHLRGDGLVHQGRGYAKACLEELGGRFELWIEGLGDLGYQGRPYDLLQEPPVARA